MYVNINEVHHHAHALYAAHGDTAEFEAAQKERQCMDTGDKQDAKDWRRIRSAIRQIRGPNAS